MNFPFLFTSRPLNVSCSLSSALNTPSQWDMVMPPVLWIYDRPEPLAVPEGKELYPLINIASPSAFSLYQSFVLIFKNNLATFWFVSFFK